MLFWIFNVGLVGVGDFFRGIRVGIVVWVGVGGSGVGVGSSGSSIGMSGSVIVFRLGSVIVIVFRVISRSSCGVIVGFGVRFYVIGRISLWGRVGSSIINFFENSNNFSFVFFEFEVVEGFEWLEVFGFGREDVKFGVLVNGYSVIEGDVFEVLVFGGVMFDFEVVKKLVGGGVLDCFMGFEFGLFVFDDEEGFEFVWFVFDVVYFNVFFKIGGWFGVRLGFGDEVF